MPSLLKSRRFTSCRACGAVRARHHPNQWSLCHNCWERVELKCSPYPVSDDAAMKWIIRKTELMARRVSIGMPLERCQCYSNGHTGPNIGYQCASPGNHIRDGRPVCGTHKNLHSVKYVEENPPSQYEGLASLFVLAAKQDPELMKALKSAIVEQNGTET